MIAAPRDAQPHMSTNKCLPSLAVCGGRGRLVENWAERAACSAGLRRHAPVGRSCKRGSGRCGAPARRQTGGRWGSSTVPCWRRRRCRKLRGRGDMGSGVGRGGACCAGGCHRHAQPGGARTSAGSSLAHTGAGAAGGRAHLPPAAVWHTRGTPSLSRRNGPPVGEVAPKDARPVSRWACAARSDRSERRPTLWRGSSSHMSTCGAQPSVNMSRTCRQQRPAHGADSGTWDPAWGAPLSAYLVVCRLVVAQPAHVGRVAAGRHQHAAPAIVLAAQHALRCIVVVRQRGRAPRRPLLPLLRGRWCRPLLLFLPLTLPLLLLLLGSRHGCRHRAARRAGAARAAGLGCCPQAEPVLQAGGRERGGGGCRAAAARAAHAALLGHNVMAGHDVLPQVRLALHTGERGRSAEHMADGQPLDRPSRGTELAPRPAHCRAAAAVLPHSARAAEHGLGSPRAGETGKHCRSPCRQAGTLPPNPQPAGRRATSRQILYEKLLRCKIVQRSSGACLGLQCRVVGHSADGRLQLLLVHAEDVLPARPAAQPWIEIGLMSDPRAPGARGMGGRVLCCCLA